VGVLIIAAIVPALVWRLLDEERFLASHLPGYTAYQGRVRYRLVPLVW
jgi:protein-S-isoprenylcysteine O-methyltransferase Ste14